MTKHHRLIASVSALMLVFVVLFSACFILAEADHDCIGEGCSICCQISICENALHSVGLAVSVVIGTVISGLLLHELPAFIKKPANDSSLVSLKVKLSD